MRAVEHAQPAQPGIGEARRVPPALDACPARLDADKAHVAVLEKGVKEADGVRSAADAGDQHVGQASLGGQNLLARLVADDALEVAHDARVGVRPQRRAEQIVRVRTLVTQSRIASLMASLSVRLPESTAAHLGAQQLHAKDVELAAARCPSCPYRRRTPAPAARRPSPWPRRAARRRSRPRCAACPSAGPAAPVPGRC